MRASRLKIIVLVDFNGPHPIIQDNLQDFPFQGHKGWFHPQGFEGGVCLQ